MQEEMDILKFMVVDLKPFDGTFVLKKKDSDRATTSIKVYGGEFVNFDPSNNASENTK